ncbi:PrsW family intramembrane metalloprotease [Archangium violaceum]|uniref:PrsW family intramembrane metalloprotease n=1 Tax=Archangium violaceum TaxID=83451 RepID=UPI0019513288|nr:PrsW family intramembrane metalloprotease [Archangium violaceum]QRN99579.1 PrsW family intramembrane metalloprotease [Archangium violaceum]
MSAFVLGGSAIVPSLLLLWYILARDKNPEPRSLLVKTFLLGVFICLPVALLEEVIQGLLRPWLSGMWRAAWLEALFVAAIPEEVFKFLVLFGYVWRKPAFNEPLDGVVYGATASLGFATLENIFYVSEGGMGVALARALSSVPAHAFFGVVMGAHTGRARFCETESERFRLLSTGLIGAIALHAAYDAVLLTRSEFVLLMPVVLFVTVFWGRRLYKRLQAEQVRVLPEVTEQILVPEWMRAAGGMGRALPADPSVPSTGLVQIPLEPPVVERTWWSWCKLILGGLGLSFSSFVLLGASMGVSGWKTPWGLAEIVSLGVVLLMVGLPSVGSFLIFRSGLRGPFAPARGP